MLSSFVSRCTARVNAQARNKKSKEVQVPARSSRKSTPRSNSSSKVKKSKQGKKSKHKQGQELFAGSRSTRKFKLSNQGQAVQARPTSPNKVTELRKVKNSGSPSEVE